MTQKIQPEGIEEMELVEEASTRFCETARLFHAKYAWICVRDSSVQFIGDGALALSTASHIFNEIVSKAGEPARLEPIY